MEVSRPLAVLSSVLLLVVTLGAQTPTPTSAPTTQPAGVRVVMPDIIRAFQADESDLRQFHDIDLSERRAQRLESFYRSWLDFLSRVDFESLDLDGRVDWVLMRHYLERRGTDIALNRRNREVAGPFLPFARAILAFENDRRTLQPVDPKAAADQLVEIKKLAAEARKALGQGTGPLASPSRVAAFQGARAVDRSVRLLRQWHSNLSGFDPVFDYWVQTPYEAAVKELEDYAKHLREEFAGQKGKLEDPLVGEPIGAEILAAHLSHEMIGYSAEELIGIGEAHFEWCISEMKRASQEMGFGDDWKKALDQVKSESCEPGQQTEFVAAEAKGAIAFCDQQEMVTIPELCRETWRLDMLSTHEQRTYPFANYGGLLMNVAFPTAEMDHERKIQSLRGNNRHFTRLVTPHELIPGHHLQRYYSRRVRQYRDLFETPFFVEGWAVFGEMYFWEKGYYRTPQERIGALLWRMHRCARITVSLKFHLGQMTPEEMIDYLVDRVGLERDGATGEVRRYIGGDYPPLYQCGYLIGAIEIMSLKKEVVDSGRATTRVFCDTLLSQNAVPIEIIRMAMLSLPITRDFRANWKFAEKR